MAQTAPTLAQELKEAIDDLNRDPFYRLLKGSGLKCQHCGYRGEDVTKRLRYIGGQGYIQVTECADRVACWGRWEEAQIKGGNLNASN